MARFLYFSGFHFGTHSSASLYSGLKILDFRFSFVSYSPLRLKAHTSPRKKMSLLLEKQVDLFQAGTSVSASSRFGLGKCILARNFSPT